MLPNVVIMGFTGLNLKYFAYFTTDKDKCLNIFSLRTAVVVGDSSQTKPAPAGNKHSVFPLPFITLF